MKKRFLILVCVEVNDSVMEADVKDYINEAVSRWSGAYDPDHPLFNIRCLNVKNAARVLKSKEARRGRT